MVCNFSPKSLRNSFVFDVTLMLNYIAKILPSSDEKQYQMGTVSYDKNFVLPNLAEHFEKITERSALYPFHHDTIS